MLGAPRYLFDAVASSHVDLFFIDRQDFDAICAPPPPATPPRGPTADSAMAAFDSLAKHATIKTWMIVVSRASYCERLLYHHGSIAVRDGMAPSTR